VCFLGRPREYGLYVRAAFTVHVVPPESLGTRTHPPGPTCHTHKNIFLSPALFYCEALHTKRAAAAEILPKRERTPSPPATYRISDFSPYVKRRQYISDLFLLRLTCAGSEMRWMFTYFF
jgi:hypothetical protein